MRLTQPTDLEILEALSGGKRNTAANLAHILDKDRAYINTRLPVLADYGLIEKVGPAPKSGLYEITRKGLVVVDQRDEYGKEGVDFDSLIEQELAERTNTVSPSA